MSEIAFMSGSTRPQKRVGVIVPSLNTIIEDDLRRFMPSEVLYHIARVRFQKENGRVTHKSLLRLADDAPSIAGYLADAGMDAIAFNCTGASVAGGVGSSERIVERIEAAVGSPATTTILSVMRALRTMNVHRLVHCCPFTSEFSEEEADFLRASGFEIALTVGMGHIDAKVAALMSPDQVAEFALRIDRADADGIFLSCANTRAMEAVQGLEQRLGKPVISSNQAVMWDLLRLISCRAPVPAGGSLFRQHELAVA
jgi:maleate isomerase